MKLICAEAYLFKLIFETKREKLRRPYDAGYHAWLDSALDIAKHTLEETPECIVRCKDCKHYRVFEEEGKTIHHCRRDEACVTPEENGFCSYGEAKEK